MKKILFVTEHPAPYWDEAFEKMKNLCKLDVIYIDKSVSSKPWKDYQFFKGTFYHEMFSVVNKIIRSDHIVIGGYYRIELRFLLILSFVLFKKVSLFTDVPRLKERSFWHLKFKKYFFKLFKYVLVSGNQGIEFFLNKYYVSSSKLLYLPYAYSSVTDSESINKSFEKFNVLISNRFIERKGHLILLKALEISSIETLNQFHFIFIGDGELKNLISNRISKIDYVSHEFLGWVSFDKYASLLKKCNFLIHPSLFEPFGIPVIDGLNEGLIVIASEGVMSAHDFIENKKNGFIYSPNDFRKLSGILKQIGDKEFDLKDISKNALKSVPNYESFLSNVFNKL